MSEWIECSKRIKAQLDTIGMTQRRLAGESGLTEVSVSRYISGEREPRATVLARMAHAMNTTPDGILETRKETKTIRCKDCRYWEAKRMDDGFCTVNDAWGWSENDWCSKAEHK